MGSEYKNVDEFARKAKAALLKIRAVYPALKLEFTDGGFFLKPSGTSISPAVKKSLKAEFVLFKAIGPGRLPITNGVLTEYRNR
jgi:hypothetical protein